MGVVAKKTRLQAGDFAFEGAQIARPRRNPHAFAYPWIILQITAVEAADWSRQGSHLAIADEIGNHPDHDEPGGEESESSHKHMSFLWRGAGTKIPKARMSFKRRALAKVPAQPPQSPSNSAVER
jgi:hypothetical protein